MKDDAKDLHTPGGLPPCSKSSQCLHFIDELSGHTSSRGESASEDVQDVALVEQLRVHVSTCPTCTATLAQANDVVTQQRRALRTILDEGEQQVPSTTAQIIAALRQEQRTPQKTLVSTNNQFYEVLPVVPIPYVREIETPRPKQTKRRLRSVVALATVAAILIASFGLLRFILPSYSSGSSTASSTVDPAKKLASSSPSITSTWSSVIITYKINDTTVIANYDPITSKSTMLTTSPYVDMLIDGVSHNGKMLLYSTYDGLKTSYYLYPQSTTNAIYETSDKSSSAVWSTDDHAIFISTEKGVVLVDAQTHATRVLLPSLAATMLLLYHNRDGYLYYVKGYNGQPYSAEGILNRINVANGDTQQVTTCPRGGNFWVSPYNATVYYNCLDQNTNLYAVNSNGANARIFRFDNSEMIGYAGDGSPLTVTHENGKYQVVQRSLIDVQQDKVLLNDIAPNAQTIVLGDIAVAPFGHAFVATGIYGGSGSDTKAQLWYGNLIAGKSQRLPLPQDARMPHVLGWDKLQISGDTLSPTVQPPPALTQVPSSSAWQNVLVTESNSNTGTTKLVNYNTTNATSFPITAKTSSSNAVVDGVSPNGKNVLYHDTSGGKTTYWTQRLFPNTGYFYIQSSNVAGNALWLPDNRNVLILSLNANVVEVDTQTVQSHPFLQLPLSHNGLRVDVAKLLFYRSGYLYFVSNDSVLSRVLVSNPDAGVTSIGSRQPNTLYWLSPDGSLIYFVNSGAAGQSGIYVVNSDGTNLHLLRPYSDARPIGYASDGALVVMRYIHNTFQVEQLGPTQAQDSVLLQNVAPGASAFCDSPVNSGIVPLCDSSIALAPYGNALVVEASYPDGSRKLWAINLQTGQRLQLATPVQGTSIRLIGWDKLTTSGS